MSAAHGLTGSSQKKPGTDMGIYQQRHCQFELKQSRGANEERLLDFKILQVQATELFTCEWCYSASEGKNDLKALQRSQAATPRPGGRAVSSLAKSTGLLQSHRGWVTPATHMKACGHHTEPKEQGCLLHRAVGVMLPLQGAQEAGH